MRASWSMALCPRGQHDPLTSKLPQPGVLSPAPLLAQCQGGRHVQAGILRNALYTSQPLRHSSLRCWSAYRPQAPPGAHVLPAHSHKVRLQCSGALWPHATA